MGVDLISAQKESCILTDDPATKEKEALMGGPSTSHAVRQGELLSTYMQARDKKEAENTLANGNDVRGRYCSKLPQRSRKAKKRPRVIKRR